MRARRIGGQRDDGGAARTASALVARALRSPAHALDAASRTELGPQLGHDLGRLRIHEGPDASAAVRWLGARALTLGSDIVLGPTAPVSAAARRRILAHEAVHSIQQGFGEPPAAGASVARHAPAEREARAIAARFDAPGRSAGRQTVGERVAPAIQYDLEEPGRLAEVHENLFVAAPGEAGGALQPWQDARTDDPGTAGRIVEQAKRAVLKLVADNPASVRGRIPTRTTESALDADALAIDERIRARFPLIPAPAMPEAVGDAVSVIGPTLTSDRDFLHQWLANKLIQWTDVETFDIIETDPRFVAMLDTLLADDDIGDHLRTLASRIGGFQRGEGATREVFIHRGAPAALRRLVLIHELVHFRAHPRYVEWIQSTTDPRFFNEGYTEWLAQRVMTDEEREGRSSYAARVEAIDQQIAAHVSEDDMVRAYFAGEVWRIETRSTIARREFAGFSGIAASASAGEEGRASRTGPGINQEVVRGTHYRFLNLGRDRADPKPEHITFFREIKARYLDPTAEARVRFVGHASTPGALEYNRDLSRRRALAFYRLARTEGLPPARLVDADRPAHLGETQPTLTEEDAQTRAFNRRVEMLVRTGAAAARRADEEGGSE